MSKENVELLRDTIDRWNRGEAVLYAFHPDVEFLPRRVATEGVYRGLAGVERFFADTEQVFDRFELRWDLLDLGGQAPREQVLVSGTIHVRARSSGIETDIPTGASSSSATGRSSAGRTSARRRTRCGRSGKLVRRWSTCRSSSR